MKRPIMSRIGIMAAATGLILASSVVLPIGLDAAGAPPSVVCTDLDPNAQEVKLGGHPTNGHYVVSDDVASVEVSVYDGDASKAFNWLSDTPLFAVITYSGSSHRIYEYNPPTRSGNGLIPPGKHEEPSVGLKAAAFCYLIDPVEEAELAVSITDSPDPVDLDGVVTHTVAVTATGPLMDPVLTVTYPMELEVAEATGCPGEVTVDGGTLTCALAPPPLKSATVTITSTAVGEGSVSVTADVAATGNDGPISATAVATTMIEGATHDHDDGDDDGHDDGHDDMDHGTKTSCMSLDSSWSSITVRGPLHSGTRMVTESGVTLWITSSEIAGFGTTVSWSSDVPMDAVIALGGPDAAVTTYQPPAMSGTGITPPLTEHGTARPLKALEFCFAPRAPVSLVLTLSGPASMVDIDDPVTVEAAVMNTGYQAAEGVEITVEGPNAFHRTTGEGCQETVDADGWAITCPLGSIDPGRTTRFGVTGTVDKIGPMELVFTVTAANLPNDVQAASMVFEIGVLGETSESTSTTTAESTAETSPPATPAPEGTGTTVAPTSGEAASTTITVLGQSELPFTGPVPEAVGWIGIFLLIVGGTILLSTRDEEEEQPQLLI